MAGIYIHIPFCKQACSYCDFHFSTQLKNKSKLVSSLLVEADLRQNYLNEKVESIYFGGGTPSLLNANEINKIINQLYKFYNIESNIEITLEANPDDLSSEYLIQLRNTPINRLSIGVQSFDQEDLQFMNRAHSASEAKSSILKAQDKGFENLTIDLIFGSPTSNLKKWEQNLDTFFSLNIPHLSAYSLTVEEGTRLAHDIRKGKVKRLEDNLVLAQYNQLQNAIKDNGFEQYEVSNYCKNESYAKHNSAYWKSTPYLGLGPSAHSFNGNSRQWNIKNNALYIKNLYSKLPYFELEELSEENRYHELLITALRTKWGISLSNFRSSFSTKIVDHFFKNLITVSDRTIVTEDYVKVNGNYLFESDNIVRELMI